MIGNFKTNYSVRMGLLYAAWFAVLGIQMPFWPLWLKVQGLGSSQIGLALMIALMAKVVAGPLFAQFADNFGIRRNLIVALGWASLASFALFTLADSVATILIITALTACLFPSIIPLADNLLLLHAREHGLHYGRVRLWGSIAFIAVSISGGAIVAAYSENIVLWLVLAALMLVVVAAILAPKESGAAARRAPGYSLTSRMRAIFKDRRLVLLLASAGAIQASHGIYYVFGTISWREAGFSDPVIGTLWALGVAAEVVVFAVIGGSGGRVRTSQLLLLSSIAGMVRWSFLPVTHNVFLIGALQCLHGLTFGATHLAAVQFLARHVPIELSATAQSLYSALSMGLIVAGSVAMSGFLYESFGVTAYWAMAAICMIGFYLALALRASQDPKSDGP
ncbi:MAG: MFS transporter [Sphingomonadales bacterium]